MGVSFCAVAPNTRWRCWPPHPTRRNRRLPGSLPGRAAPPKPNWRPRKRKAARWVGFVTHPLTHRAGAGVGRQLCADGLRRRRRDGRAGTRRARLRIRASNTACDILPVIHVDGEHFDDARWQDWYADKVAQRRCHHQLRTTGAGLHARSSAVDAITQALTERRPGRQDHHLAAARLGHQPPALLGHADPDHPLRRQRRCTRLRLGAGAAGRSAGAAARRPGARRQRQPARRSARPSSTSPCPDLRPAGAARNRHDGHLRRLGLVRRCATACPDSDRRDGRRAQRLLDADGPVHRRHRARGAAPAVRALLDQGDARHRAGDFGEPFTNLFTQGMLLNDCYYRDSRRSDAPAASQAALVLSRRSRGQTTTRATRPAPPRVEPTACR